MKTYNRHWKKFCEFTSMYSLSPIPASGLTVLQFIAYLHSKSLSPATIRGYLTSVSFFHKIQNFPDPSACFLIRRALIGLKKTVQTRSKLSPITKPLLDSTLRALSSVTKNLYTLILLRALFSFTYHACLRAGEVVLSSNPRNVILLSQVQPLKTGGTTHFTISFKNYKHSRPDRHTPKMILSPNGNFNCPVNLLQKYLTIRGNIPGPLFVDEKGLPLTRRFFSQYLKKSLSFIGPPHKKYNTHSLRIGRVTDLKLNGLDEETIKTTGRWNTNAFMNYIRPYFFALPR